MQKPHGRTDQIGMVRKAANAYFMIIVMLRCSIASEPPRSEQGPSGSYVSQT